MSPPALEGRVALVVGGASGLGAAAAARLARAGAVVSVLDRQSTATVAGVADHAELDVTDEQQVEEVVADVRRRLGPPRICLIAAGVVRTGRIVPRAGHRLTTEDVREVLDVNVIGTFTVLSVVARAMAEATVDADGQRGVIVTVGSVADRDGQAGTAAYAASKGAVRALALAAARDLAPLGIRCVSIAPATFDTAMVDGLPQATRARLEQGMVNPPRMGDPEEFAALVEHVCRNPYLNGTTIELDGAGRLPLT